MNKQYRKPVFIAFALLLVMIVISIFFVTYMQGLVNKSILMNLGEITKQDAEKIQNRIQEHKRILETIVKEIEEENVKTEQDIFNIYNRNSGNAEFSRMAILYKNGKTSTSDGKVVDLSDEINEFFGAENIQISKSRRSKVDNDEINIYSKKIYFQNEEIVVLLAIDNDKYRNLFTQNIFYGNGIECMITSKGDMIANSKNEENNGNVFDDFEKANEKEIDKINNMRTEILENDEGQINYKIQGQTYYISYQKLMIEDWSLIVIVPGNVIAKDLIQLLEIIVMIAMMIVITTLLVTIYILISNIKQKEKLYELAYIDSITNLGNYHAYLKEIRENVQIEGKKTIIILDIDKFKTFNKKYGHIKGNELLKRIGEEITAAIRKNDVVCRLGNDVFGIFFKEEVDFNSIIERLNQRLTRIKLQDYWYNIRICIGVYISDVHEKDVQGMIDKAIIAHDSVKGNYYEPYGMFTQEIEEKLSKESEIENMMEGAIRNKEFVIYYQPQIETKTGKIGGAEALVRWNKKGKFISPNDFIPLFEKNLFIIKLDEYIYETVCQDMKELKKEGYRIPKISVNVSRESLMEKDFIEKYIKIANKYEIRPNEIEIEITERTAVNDKIDMKHILEQIKEKGFGIALDDFGTGYSSLNMLEELPIDTLKIDKSFIDKIGQSHEMIHLLEIIFMITQKLQLKSVAEGVEKNEQIEYLKTLQCDFIQGYFYAKPLDYTTFKLYIRENTNDL